MSSRAFVGLAFAAIGVLVAAGYLRMAAANVTEWGHDAARDEDYNLLVEGFQDGHLHLRREAPAGLRQLADPYDPAANAVYRAIPYRLDDLSFYGGKLYLYFGAAPALLLFWPWATLTGDYLFQRTAVALFCSAGFWASLALLYSCWRRYFAAVPAAVALALAAALGLLTGAPILLQKADVWEVPIACGYALTMLALGAVWRALHDEPRRGRWLAAASLGCGLAIAARPSLAFGAAMLLLPLGAGRALPAARRGRLLLCAAAPLLACGLAILWYNAGRFSGPLDFGEGYQLGLYRQDNARHFSLGYLPFNAWVYFLQPVRWGGPFPFIASLANGLVPPAGHAAPEDPFGVLTNLPWLGWAAAVPLAWRRRAPDGASRPIFLLGLAAPALLFASSALVLGLFYGNCSRYEMDFLPALALLAAVGVLEVERRLRGRPAALRLGRTAWLAALAASLGSMGLIACAHFADQRFRLGNARMGEGRVAEAIVEYERALRVQPGHADASGNLGAALLRAGRVPEAIARDRETLRLAPGSAGAHFNLGGALLVAGRRDEAAREYAEAYRLRPDLAPPRAGR